MSTKLQNHLATDALTSVPDADPHFGELSHVLDLFQRAWRAECGMKIEVIVHDTNAAASEMLAVGNKWLECEAEMSLLCDQLDGESQIYLAVDTMYRLLPRYRATLECLLYAADRLRSMATEMADQAQLQSLIIMGAHAAHDYYDHLYAMDDTRFPPLRHGHFVRH